MALYSVINETSWLASRDGNVHAGIMAECLVDNEAFERSLERAEVSGDGPV